MRYNSHSFLSERSAAPADIEMAGQTGNSIHQHSSNVVLELPSQKGVKNGVDAEVQASDVSGDVLDIREFAVAVSEISMLIYHDYDIIRTPESKKHQDDYENEPHGAMFPYHPRGHDCQCYPEVAVDEDNQREDEEHHELLVEAEDLPIRVARVRAHQSVLRIVIDGEVDEGIETRQKTNAPDR